MWSARTLENDKYEGVENRTHDTAQPTARDSVTQYFQPQRQLIRRLLYSPTGLSFFFFGVVHNWFAF